jgi:dTDP-4-amino-4,6-dideoxygalactose transaminase
MSATPFTVPLTDIRLSGADVAAVLAALADGWQPDGPLVARLEHELAQALGTPGAVGVSSGSAALHLALLAAGVGPGDEVLVPGLTFVASAAAVRYCGATPVLCDVEDPTRPLLDPEDAAARITSRTAAMVPVHLYGYGADTVALRALCQEHGLRMIEDCAQAIGARVGGGVAAGAAGDFGCFSLFSKKQLCVGEGGMVVAGDAALVALARELRDPAAPGGPGVSMTLGEPHAALALSRLPRLREDLERRRAAVRAYRERLADVPGVEPAFRDDEVGHASHFAFVVLLRDRGARDAVRTGLHGRGVQTTWYPSLTSFTAYAGAASLPRVEESAARHVALPLSSGTTVEQVDAVVGALRATLAELS